MTSARNEVRIQVGFRAERSTVSLKGSFKAPYGNEREPGDLDVVVPLCAGGPERLDVGKRVIVALAFGGVGQIGRGLDVVKHVVIEGSVILTQPLAFRFFDKQVADEPRKSFKGER